MRPVISMFVSERTLDRFIARVLAKESLIKSCDKLRIHALMNMNGR